LDFFKLATIAKYDVADDAELTPRSMAIVDSFHDLVSGKTKPYEYCVLPPKKVTELVEVPSSEHVAEIIGRDGHKIKELREKTKTFIRTPTRGQEPVFLICGAPEDVLLAKTEIAASAEYFTMLRSMRGRCGPFLGKH
jgi:hypothetical protein